MRLTLALSLLAVGLAAGTAVFAQNAPAPAAGAAPAAPATPPPFAAGGPLGITANGQFTAMSANAKVYGGVFSAESCSYDAGRGVIVVPNRGLGQNVTQNDAFVSLLNHDGSVNTARWIGVNRNGLTLNEPFGSDIAGGFLYVADRNGGTSATDPSISVVRKFSMATGAPAGEFLNPQSTGLNDIAVAADGTIYGTNTGGGGATPDPTTWKIWKITAAGVVSEFASGAPMFQPNGIAFDPQGNIVVVNIGSADVLTYDLTGKVIKTEKAAQAGNDGLVIMADGTKYVSSVLNGGVSRIKPNAAAELIATNIPSAASMCYDAGANQLVIPMNNNNGLAFIKL